MNAVITKFLGVVLTAIVSKLGPELLSAVLAKVGTKFTLPNISGLLKASELETLILKYLGYSTLPGLAVGVLSWLSVHDSDYIKDASLAYLVTFVLGLCTDALKKAYAGVDPSLAPSLSPDVQPAKSPATNLPPNTMAPMASCSPETSSCNCPGFTGTMVEPTKG